MCLFRLTISRRMFQKHIYNAFRKFLNDNTVVIYMDDLIIPSKDKVEKLENFKLVLENVSEYGLE